MDLHVGRGVTRGALTVFPVWNGDGGPRGYSTRLDKLVVGEDQAGPSVPGLVATYAGTKPALVLEGYLFEGGWQHRMAVSSVLLAPGQPSVVEVACVEHGRWGGAQRQAARGRRATPFVRSGASIPPDGQDRQGEVWRRVETYVGRARGNATGSLVGHLDDVESDVRRTTAGLRPLAGQAGVVIGIAGQPVMVEVFDDPRTLREQFDSIIAAAGLDALGQPEVATPARRARRLVERLEAVQLMPCGPAGVGTRLEARNEYVDASALTWRARTIHLRATNVRHPMLMGV